MSEVSCKALILYFETLERREIPREQLVEGLGLDLAVLSDTRRRIPWDDFAAVTDRMGELLGGEEALCEMGRSFLAIPTYARMGRVVRLAVSPRQLYQLSFRVMGAWMFHAMEYELRAESESHIRVGVRIPPPYRPSRAFFHVGGGALAAYPVQLGYPPAELEIDVRSEREAHFDLHIVGEWGALGRPIRQRLSFLAGLVRPGVYLDQLVERQKESRELMRALQHERVELNQSRAALLDKVRELEQVREALVRSEERYRSLAESAPDYVVHLDADRVVRYVNRTRFMAVDRIIDHRLDDILMPAQAESVRRALDDVFLRGQASEFTALYPVEGGRVLHFEVRVTPILRGGDVVGAMVVGRDVSEQVRAGEERLELERKLLQTQKLESLGLLAGGIAHDFNNLITGIQANVEMLLLYEGATDAGNERRLRRIGRAAARAADLTNRILAYSGRAPNVVQPFDLNDLVDEVGDLLAAALPKNVRLETRLAEALPAVEADPAQVQQVAMNLITNAAEATESQDGVVWVRTRSAEVRDPLSVDTVLAERLRPGRYVVLEVSDEGGGVSPADRARMFDPFWSTKGQGRGLGLSTVIGVIRGHGGALEVDTGGQGTTFRAWFPACRAEVASRVAHVPAPPPAAGGTVLVVDDEEIVRQTAVDLLEAYGFRALSASDGHEALEVVAADPDLVDVVLLDWSMPGLSGADVFEALRRRWPGLPVVLSSAYDLHEELEGLWHHGLAAFVRKPWSGRELSRVLRLQRRIPAGEGLVQ